MTGSLKARVSGAWQPILGSNQIAAGNSLGIVAVGSMISPTAQTIAANGTLIITNGLIFTPLVGRRYEIFYLCRAISAPTTNHTRASLFLDGADAFDTYGDRYVMSIGGTGYTQLPATWLMDGDGVQHTFAVQLWVGGNATNTVFTSPGCHFYIRDIGPNSYPAMPVPATSPPWTAITTFANGWGNYGSGMQTPRYRKIGDIVYLEGGVAGGTLGSTMFTLPVGFRPAMNRQFAVTSWASVAGIQISTGGGVNSTSGGDNRYIGTEAVFSVT